MNRRSEEAEALARAWEDRARSDLRNYFVASHPGWSDEGQWEECARRDAAVALHGVGAERLASARVLEMGCGVGRLAAVIAPLCASYRGYDLAPTMVEQARRELEGVEADARFAVGSGEGVPAEFGDTSFHFAIAWGVFIHLSRAVALPNLRGLVDALESGGELRVQFRADPLDATPASDAMTIDAGELALPRIAAISEVDAGTIAAEPSNDDPRVAELTDTRDSRPSYIGHAWSVDDLRATLEALGGVEVKLDRPDPYFVYALVRRV